MSLLKYVQRFRRMHDLIRARSTGSPEQFARKLNISRSVLMDNLRDLRDLGADIRYSQVHQSYYYHREFVLVIGVKDKLSNVTGGKIADTSISSPLEFFNEWANESDNTGLFYLTFGNLLADRPSRKANE